MDKGHVKEKQLKIDNFLVIKVSGPFVETSCVFQCIKNIINAEMWTWKNDYN